MTDFDKNIIDQLVSFGFKLHTSRDTGIGAASEYKYYPKYLGHSHYTLVLFNSHQTDCCDHRLYTHNNTDGSFVSALYQIGTGNEWGQNYVNDEISKIFKTEIRISTMRKLLV